MAHGFDDNKGKVDLNAIFDELETNYQANINTMYDACDSAGVTPTAKTPEAVATAIAGIKTKYESDTWEEYFQLYVPLSDSSLISEISLDNVVSIEFDGFIGTKQTGATVSLSTHDHVSTASDWPMAIRHWDAISAGTIIGNFTNSEKVLRFNISNQQKARFTITRQTKVLR